MAISRIVLSSVESSGDGIAEEDGVDSVLGEVIFRLIERWGVLANNLYLYKDFVIV